MTFAEYIAFVFVRAARNAALRREGAQARCNPRPPMAVIPADVPLPRPVRDVGGHDASGEGR